MDFTHSQKEYNGRARVVFVLDNDECIGAWSIASAIHSLFATYVPKNTGIPKSDCLKVLKSALVKYYFSNGGARPGTKATLKLIKFYKDVGMIDKVIMFTSSNNGLGWVNFLKECLEEYVDAPGLYDLVLHRDNTPSSVSSDGATMKSLDLVRNKLGFQNEKTSIIMIDDKPHNIIGEGARIRVSPYRHIVDEKHIDKMIDDVIDTLELMYVFTEKTYAPKRLRHIIKHTILIDNDGIKREVSENTHIHRCPINQLNDTNLIENGVKAFMDHITPLSLVRSISGNIDCNLSPSPPLKRALSL